MLIRKFYGTPPVGEIPGHCPMWWGVEVETFQGDAWHAPSTDYTVVESYDNGETWAANCTFDSEQAARDFVAAGFSQFYQET